jgi:hypothetical protein
LNEIDCFDVSKQHFEWWHVARHQIGRIYLC